MTRCLATFAILFFTSFSFVSAQKAHYETTTTGVNIVFDHQAVSAIEQSLTLTPISDQIIHVRVTKDRDAVKNQDFITVDSLYSNKVEWELEEQGDSLIIKTSSLNANV